MIDAAQLERKDKQRCLLRGAVCANLFEHTIAESALHLSPVIVALASDPKACREQIVYLDQICRHLPIMALLHSVETPDALATHLRSMLMIESESTPHMLRFADSEMLAAANAVFTDVQRALFFRSTASWFTVDHEGLLHDAAGWPVRPSLAPSSTNTTIAPPLTFDEVQSLAMIDAAAAPILASRMRYLDTGFKDRLSHAEQIRFAVACIADAEHAAVDMENQLIPFATARWETALESLGPIS